ncbi:spore cortex-lytic protein [Zongyangia hominis]|uniref:Spore cortex-lytic protein n=1 Tax=Zongyangia hominis TaxID=2763677 RepID=A0A926IC68_9FIRM|nr:spore cortex-lytic protein [Zongyangia hominis]MBC8570795.1 spore cortex-lytic protein [Zongyangia hominis]
MPSQGYLFARVFTSDAMIPVEDATVTVTQISPEGLVELLAVWLTDESGKTDMLMVPTPDLAASQAPSEEQPFASVNITAEHPLYERIIVRDVQVFPNTVSEQELQLIPLNEFPEVWDQTESFDVPPQNL